MKSVKTISLIRAYLDNCTIGKMYFEGKFICYSVEKTYLSNKPFVSCIPPGEYKIQRHNGEHHKDSFYLSNHDLGVSHLGLTKDGPTTRSAILIHVANFPKEVVGCIGVGMTLHPTMWGVGQSKNAMKMLNDLINFDYEWRLKIS